MHPGWALRQRVEERPVVPEPRSGSVGSTSCSACQILALTLVDQAGAVPTQKVGAGRVQDPNAATANTNDRWTSPSLAHGAPVHPPAATGGCTLYARSSLKVSRPVDSSRVARLSEAAKEIQNILLLPLVERIEVMDHGVCLGRTELRVPGTLVSLNRLEQIVRPSVVQQEDPLSEAPQWCRPEFVAPGVAFENVIGQPAHAVEQEVRVEVDGFVAQRRHCHVSGF